MSANREINCSTSYKDFDNHQLVKMQEDYSKRKYLTVPEASIWLMLSQNSIRRLIKKGQIAAFRAFGSSAIRIDVEKTKEIMEKSLNINNLKEDLEQSENVNNYEEKGVE